MRWTRIGGMTALMVALAIGLALSLGVWHSWTAGAQGNTFVINDVDPPEAGCGTPDYTTTDINSVIALATVHNDDTLVLCQGTYQGGITVDKRDHHRGPRERGPEPDRHPGRRTRHRWSDHQHH